MRFLVRQDLLARKSSHPDVHHFVDALACIQVPHFWCTVCRSRSAPDVLLLRKDVCHAVVHLCAFGGTPKVAQDPTAIGVLQYVLCFQVPVESRNDSRQKDLN
jgi:hypothetical protein